MACLFAGYNKAITLALLTLLTEKVKARLRIQSVTSQTQSLSVTMFCNPANSSSVDFLSFLISFRNGQFVEAAVGGGVSFVFI